MPEINATKIIKIQKTESYTWIKSQRNAKKRQNIYYIALLKEVLNIAFAKKIYQD